MKAIPLISRIFIVAILIVSGAAKIFDTAGTQGYIESVGLPLPMVALIIAIVVELVTGIWILLGWKTKFMAWVAVLYLVVVTIIFHTDFSQQLQQTMFLKNLALIGGLLLLAHFGPDDLAIDTYKRKPAEITT